MIQVRMEKYEVREPNPSLPILSHMVEKLEKEQFFGKIILTFEKGFLRNAKVEQSFTLNDLVNTFIP